MATYITTGGADYMLNAALNTSGVWVALGSGYSSGTFSEIVTGIGYARQFVNNWVVSSGQANPPSGVTFGPATSSGWTVSTLGIFTTSANGSGSPFWVGFLQTSGQVSVGQNASFASGSLTLGFQTSGA